MRTVQISQEEMEEQRVARFEELVTWDVQRNPDVPLDVLDLLYARELCMAVAPAGLTGPFVNTASIKDVDFSMTWAKCPTSSIRARSRRMSFVGSRTWERRTESCRC